MAVSAMNHGRDARATVVMEVGRNNMVSRVAHLSGGVFLHYKVPHLQRWVSSCATGKIVDRLDRRDG
jgi:hypothetical protein